LKKKIFEIKALQGPKFSFYALLELSASK